MRPEYNAKVVGKIEFAPGNFVLRVAPVGWDLAEFLPGQYAVLGLMGDAPRTQLSEAETAPSDPAKMIKRAYSIASSSVTRDHLEFYISLVRSGALTPRLHSLNVGDGVWLSKKSVGMFTLDTVPDGTNVVLIATGTGLAPYMSMMRTLIMQGNVNSHFAVIHGARNSWDLGYRSELMMLERLQNNFTYIPVISEPQNEKEPWGGASGFVEHVWKGDFITKGWARKTDPKDTHVFLCGNPLMINSALKFLGEDGYTEFHKIKSPNGQIHLEHFW